MKTQPSFPFRVLGVDPGIGVTGYGIIEETENLRSICHGQIQTKATHSFSDRLLTIYNKIEEEIERFQPSVLAVEDIFYAKNVKSALILGHARGVVLVCAAKHGLAIAQYSPLEVKKALVGYGRASKEQVKNMVEHLLGSSCIFPYDASDALAVAICYCHSRRVEENLEKAVSLEKLFHNKHPSSASCRVKP